MIPYCTGGLRPERSSGQVSRVHLRHSLNTKSCSVRWLWQEKHAVRTEPEAPCVRSSPANTSNPQPPVPWYRVASLSITATLFLDPSKVAPGSWRTSRCSSTHNGTVRKMAGAKALHCLLVRIVVMESTVGCETLAFRAYHQTPDNRPFAVFRRERHRCAGVTGTGCPGRNQQERRPHSGLCSSL